MNPVIATSGLNIDQDTINWYLLHMSLLQMPSKAVTIYRTRPPDKSE